MLSRLQYISQGNTSEEQLRNIEAALAAGCNWIQLRFKNAAEEELLSLAKEVKGLCATHYATFIMNDHATIAKAVDIDGVHLGLQDMSVREAREILEHKIIGGTANTLEDVLQRVGEGCDYVGLGPLRFTSTKEKLSPMLGLKGYKNIMNALQQDNINMPVYAIGGIVAEDVEGLIEAGVYGIAVSGIITHHPDKKLLVEQFNSLLYGTVEHSR